MKKIKPKMNENQKIEFILSYCDQLVGDHISQQDYLVFKKELRDSLKASKSIQSYDHNNKSGWDWGVRFYQSDNNGHNPLFYSFKTTKLKRATLSQLKEFANQEVFEFLS